MPSELTLQEKIEIALELGSDVLVGILRRRAAAKGMDVGTLLIEATNNSQEADQVLDALESKGHEPPANTEGFDG